MIDARYIERVLAHGRTVPWQGTVFRVTLNDFPADIQNTRGARWNPADLAAIYTSLDPTTCVKEVDYNLKLQSRPVKATLRRNLYEIKVSLDSVVNLDDLRNELEEIGISDGHLFADDMMASQEIGRLVTWLGHDGLIVPSARAAGKNLVIYPSRTNADSYEFEVVSVRQI